jgi:hypothetical protein
MANIPVSDVFPSFTETKGCSFVSYIAISPSSFVRVTKEKILAPSPSPVAAGFTIKELDRKAAPEAYVLVDIYDGRVTVHFSQEDADLMPADFKTFVPFRFPDEEPDEPNRLMLYPHVDETKISSSVAILSHQVSDTTAVFGVDRWQCDIKKTALVGFPTVPVLVLKLSAGLQNGKIFSFSYHVTVTSPCIYPSATTEQPDFARLGRLMVEGFDKDFITPKPNATPN